MDAGEVARMMQSPIAKPRTRPLTMEQVAGVSEVKVGLVPNAVATRSWSAVPKNMSAGCLKVIVFDARYTPALATFCTALEIRRPLRV